MNPTVTNPTKQTLNRALKVEFYPSVDDFIYVADRINNSASTSNSTMVLVYYAYILVNVFAMPIILWFADQFLAGVLIFVFNLGAALFMIPSVNKAQYNKYYRNLYGELENHKSMVELDVDGVRFESKGNHSFLPWENIKSIEETETSIYFHYDHNAISIQKSGFAYDSDSREFLDFARLKQAGNRQL